MRLTQYLAVGGERVKHRLVFIFLAFALALTLTLLCLPLAGLAERRLGKLGGLGGLGGLDKRRPGLVAVLRVGVLGRAVLA